jgi:hypothetical protein
MDNTVKTLIAEGAIVLVALVGWMVLSSGPMPTTSTQTTKTQQQTSAPEVAPAPKPAPVVPAQQ